MDESGLKRPLPSGGEADWQERGLLDSLDERFGIPTTVFELED